MRQSFFNKTTKPKPTAHSNIAAMATQRQQQIEREEIRDRERHVRELEEKKVELGYKKRKHEVEIELLVKKSKYIDDKNSREIELHRKDLEIRELQLKVLQQQLDH